MKNAYLIFSFLLIGVSFIMALKSFTIEQIGVLLCLVVAFLFMFLYVASAKDDNSTY